MKKIKGEGFGKYEGEYHKVNIIQFLPCFPPHKGGLETVAQELACFYIEKLKYTFVYFKKKDKIKI